MTRFPPLLAAAALAALAGAGASGRAAPPFQPSPGTECSQAMPHPIVCAQVAVRCPARPRAGVLCRTTEASVPPRAAVTLLTIEVARRITSLALDCRSNAAAALSCRVRSVRTGAATGTRKVLLTLPGKIALVRISCSSRPGGAFACRRA